jgi:hypothetical protein
LTTTSVQFLSTRRRVERAACNSIVKCLRKLGLEEVPLPIPVEDWVEGPLGIKFGVADLSHLGPNVLGAVFVAQNEILVSDSILNQEGRFRFTVAHELGHLTLHSKVAMSFHETTDESHFVNRRIERDADRFAAAFLMPTPLLAREFTSFCQSANIDPVKVLPAVAAGEERAIRAFQDSIVPKLAHRFAVSKSAAICRFADVQLPTGEPGLPAEVLSHMLRPNLPTGSRQPS